MASGQTLDSQKIEIRMMIKASKFPQARILATKLLKEHANDDELLFLRGTACAFRSANEQAEKDLRSAIALRPRKIKYYLNLCDILLSNSQYELAFIEYVRARMAVPSDPGLSAFYDLLVGEDGKIRKALDRLEQRYKKNDYDDDLVDILMELYLLNALCKWTSYYDNGKLDFTAKNQQQIEEAEQYLDRAKFVLVMGEAGRTHRARLEIIINKNKRQLAEAANSSLAV